MMSRFTRSLGKMNWKYLLTEILLIVIGINVGLWFNTLSNNSQKRAQERELLEEMKVSLQQDQEVFASILEIHRKGMAAGNRLLVPTACGINKRRWTW